MDEKSRAGASKFLSYVLRHEPAAVGIALDSSGWVAVEVLLDACAQNGRRPSRAELEEIVATSPKQRFALSAERQLRDHYVDVNGCTPQTPTDPAGNSGTHICRSYQGCSEGHPVRWCAHGGDHNPTEKDSGQAKSWVPGEAWTFISQF